MKIKDLEVIRNSLDKLITESKDDTRSKSLIQVEKTAFVKYQAFIAGAISFRRRKRTSYDRVCPETLQLDAELKQYQFIADTITGFIEAELDDERDKLVIN